MKTAAEYAKIAEDFAGEVHTTNVRRGAPNEPGLTLRAQLAQVYATLALAAATQP